MAGPEKASIVACLGSSSTAGKGQAFDWVRELERRLDRARFLMRNFGVGGDLAYNALQRLSSLTRSHPEKVVVFIGGNDVLALVSEKVKRWFRFFKRLPSEPSAQWFRENLQAIVERLKSETSAEIGLCSLPPIGEDLASEEPFQRELNRRIEEFSLIVQETSQEQATAYIPLYEPIRDQIAKEPAARAFTEFRFFPFYRDAFRTMVLRKTPDQVAQLNGWRFHTDGVHLNSRSGLIVANRVQEFIEKRSASRNQETANFIRFESDDSV